jgi:hypothetical protein
MPQTASVLRSWPVLVPVLAVLALVLTWGRDLGPAALVAAAALLAGAVLAAVHHAEVVALRVGEPYGSLILAVAVTVIEVALIVTIMISANEEASALARDTVFAAVMITINGIVGITLLIATLRRRVAVFNAEGTGGALATVAALATMTLVLPTFTTSTPGPTFSSAQLAYAAVASFALYGLFVFVQTVRHRDYFLPVTDEGGPATADEHVPPPETRVAVASLMLLLIALIGVVGLAKTVSPTGGGGRSYSRPTACGRRRGDRAAGTASGDACGSPRGTSRPDTDQFQPRPWLGNGQHRPHHPDNCSGVDLARPVTSARPGRDPDSAVRVDGGCRRAHRDARKGDPAASWSAPGAVRRFPGARGQSLMTRRQRAGPAVWVTAGPIWERIWARVTRGRWQR